MADFGVVPEGFRRKTLQDILTELEEEQRATVSPNINTSPSSPHGQLNASYSRQMALAWEALEVCYDAIDRDRSEGEALDALGKLTGTRRRGATYSEVTCTCNLDDGTTLVSGAHFAEVQDQPANRWTPKADFTKTGGTGNADIVFRSELQGEIAANSNTITVISTAVTGWNSVNNALDADPGRPIDTDPIYRLRQEADLTRAGSTSVSAIRSDLLNLEVAGVLPILQCTVLENDTDALDSLGLPPHSIECLILDNPVVANNTIAAAIWEAKAAGIRAYGSEFGTVTLDDGSTKDVNFSRPTSRDIYLTYTTTTVTGYPGDTAFKAAVVATLRANHGLGADVLRWECELAGKVEGVTNLSLTLGFAASPSGTSDLPIEPRELAAFDTSRIVVV